MAIDEMEVGRLCEDFGYGRVMQIASSLWGKKEGSRGGNHTVGACAGLLVPCECSEFPCDWCCGTHTLTEKVKEIKDIMEKKDIKPEPPKAPCATIRIKDGIGMLPCDCGECWEGGV